jgi:hypothetical protein
MAEKKGWGSSVIGWFVVQDDGTPGEPDTTDERPPGSRRPAPSPPLDVFADAPPPPAPGGKVAFNEVFQAAGIDADESARVTKTLELLDSLPAGTDEAVKRQIVMASLRAFGVPVDQIIETGAQELQALEAYIRAGGGDTEKVIEDAESRIRQYEEEIANLRTVMQQRVEEQKSVVSACNSKKLEIQRVLEFFGQEAVAKVVRQSPKLKEPD